MIVSISGNNHRDPVMALFKERVPGTFPGSFGEQKTAENRSSKITGLDRQ
jgi:hypothetical protein